MRKRNRRDDTLDAVRALGKRCHLKELLCRSPKAGFYRIARLE